MTGERQPLLHGKQYLADAEQSDHRHQEVEPGEQLGEAEREPQLAGYDVDADRRHGKAQHHRGDDLERIALAGADEAAESQQIHREELGRPELQREIGD